MTIAISTMWLPAGAHGRDLLVSRLGAALQLLTETDTVEARVEQAHRQRPLHAVILVASLVCHCLQHQLQSCLMVIQVVSTLIYYTAISKLQGSTSLQSYGAMCLQHTCTATNSKITCTHT